jgi:hypothetical protein
VVTASSLLDGFALTELKAPVYPGGLRESITIRPHFRQIKCKPLNEIPRVPSPHHGHLSPGIGTWFVFDIKLTVTLARL